MASSGVTAVQAPSTAPAEQLAAEVSTLEIKEETAADGQVAPHRSHDPQFNQKRSDPFQFGSRFLSQDDDEFEFNAWDHVQPDDVFMEYAEKQYAMQRDSPVSDFDKRTYFLLCYTLSPSAPLLGHRACVK